MRNYSPRRASKRWLNGAPDYILDCFYHPQFADCYTVFFGKRFAFHRARDGSTAEGCGDYANTYLTGIGTSETGGVSGGFEMEAYEVANYRYRNKHRRIRWQDMPKVTRRLVMNYAESE